jgi:hypothetical protein
MLSIAPLVSAAGRAHAGGVEVEEMTNPYLTQMLAEAKVGEMLARACRTTRRTRRGRVRRTEVPTCSR